MPSEDGSTAGLLKNYHDASKRKEAWGRSNLIRDGENTEAWDKLTAVCREAVSRCILSDDPRVIIHLFYELSLVMKIVGQIRVAEAIEAVVAILSLYYNDHGTL